MEQTKKSKSQVRHHHNVKSTWLNRGEVTASDNKIKSLYWKTRIWYQGSKLRDPGSRIYGWKLCFEGNGRGIGTSSEAKKCMTQNNQPEFHSFIFHSKCSDILSISIFVSSCNFLSYCWPRQVFRRYNLAFQMTRQLISGDITPGEMNFRWLNCKPH